MKFSIIIAFILGITLSITSCKKADVQFGSEWLPSGNTQIVRVDSFTPTLTTAFLDSFVTSNKGTLLIGSYNDPYFGRLTSESYFEVTPPTYYDIFSQTTFDSIKIILKPNSFYYGDTTKAIHFSVSQLAEKIVSKNYDNSNQYYNNQSFAVGSSSLGSATKFLSPYRKDNVEITLNNSFGQGLLKILQDPNNTIMKTSKDFMDYFYGINIKSSNSDNTFAGFSDTVIMRLYYTKGAIVPENKTVDFNLSNRIHQFNHITADRSGISNTALKNISAINNEVPSSATGNMAYDQPLSGLMTKIHFYSINDIQKQPYFVKILKAELILKPVVGSYNFDSYKIPPSLRLSTSNPLNQLLGDILSVGGNGSSAVQTGNLYIDYLNSANTQYSYDLTPYIKSLLNNTTGINNGLLLTPPFPAFQTEASRILIGDSHNPDAKAQLVIYYAAVQ